jgi:nucleoid-associated protein YgaU
MPAWKETVMRLPFGKKESAQPKGKTIKSQPGDTLRSIALREYGDESKWEVIYKANAWRIDDPSYLNVGTDLLIPGKE